MADGDGGTNAFAMLLMVVAVVAIVGLFTWFITGQSQQQKVLDVPSVNIEAPKAPEMPKPATP